MFSVMQPVIEANPRTVPEGIRLLQYGLTDLRRRVRLDVYEQPLDALCTKLRRSPRALYYRLGYMVLRHCLNRFSRGLPPS